MKNLKLISICIIVVGMNFSFAQSNGLAKSIGVYVFPNKNQTTETQNKDESDCYKWAMDQTNYDPMNPTVVTANVVDSSPDGEAIIGAAKGAAAGAAIGSISGNMGDGAAYGAIAGGIRGRRTKKSQDQHQQQANNATASAKTTEMADDYRKAFSTCLQAKGYTVN
ncbi:glycine zipper domain-containing protein [Desulfosarcina sp.]|nr:glycine zipper domain-containing protein [Desulfosarcina sp.]